MLRPSVMRLGWICFALAATSVVAQEPVSRDGSESARIDVTGPTVIAYLVVAPGAVDKDPDLAVVTDDWSYAMAALGDSLEARGIRFALVTEPRLELTTRSVKRVSFSLVEGLATGYVFAIPGRSPCIRRGAADSQEVLAAAGRFFRTSNKRALSCK